MCLFRKLTTKEKIFGRLFGIVPKPLIAKEDIICYKVFQYSGGERYRTYHRQTNIEIKPDCEVEMIPSSNIQDTARLTVPYYGSFFPNYDGLNVEGGFIHTYTQKDYDKNVRNFVDLMNPEHKLIENAICTFECVIPKGTEYYKGDNETGTYASKRIIIKKMIW